MKKTGLLALFFILLAGCQQSPMDNLAPEATEKEAQKIVCKACGRELPYTLQQLDEILVELDPDFDLSVFGFQAWEGMDSIFVSMNLNCFIRLGSWGIIPFWHIAFLTTVGIWCRWETMSFRE